MNAVRSSPGTYRRLFLEDAARWVQPQQVVPLSEVRGDRLVRMLWRHLPLRAMAWFRFGSWAKSAGIPGIPGVVQRRIARRYGLEISPGADVAGGLYVAHPYGTTISADAIGRNVTIVGCVTIGMRSTPGRPRIADGVFIGTGARVLGAITVGQGAAVGANAVVIHDVPPRMTVMGIPARARPRRTSKVAADVAGSGARE